jgi:transposase
VEHAPGAAILFDKFHVLRHLGEALDKVRKREYAQLTGKDRRFIKGQKYTLLSHRENLTNEGRQSLRMLPTSGSIYGLCDEEYLRLKILTCILEQI